MADAPVSRFREARAVCCKTSQLLVALFLFTKTLLNYGSGNGGGNGPGGGGSAGGTISGTNYSGGNGAFGAVWFVARQPG